MIDQTQLSQTDKDAYEDLIRNLNEENTILNDQVIRLQGQNDRLEAELFECKARNIQ